MLPQSATAEATAEPTPGPAIIFVTNFKGNSVQLFSLTGSGLGVFCTPAQPTGVAVDQTGNLFVASDASPYSIQKYLPDGSGSVFVSSGLKGPHALAFDQNGNLYVANSVNDTIQRFAPDGTGTLFADAADGLVHPTDLVFDTAGNLFVTNAFGGPQGTGSVSKIAPDGTAAVFAETGFSTAYGLAIDSAGNIYVSSFTGNTVKKFADDGIDLGVFLSAPLKGPHGMVFDSDGNLYVANNSTNTIEKFSSAGVYLGTFGSTGSGPHFFALSTQIPAPTPAPPSITGQPASRSVVVGTSASFTVKATGTDPLSYQWARDGKIITKGTKPTYTLTSTTSEDNGAVFFVVVTNPLGSVTSDSAILTIKTAPVITTQPADVMVNVGQTATFSVTATGAAPLKYQWRKNGAPITGATRGSYTTPSTTAGD
ncbi:MAG: hypothetical protein M3Q46_08530, partial [Verrucomicrobiota bacterium]|nr:hypothetical protein [Verrucomicrobiota bacterium]